MLSPKGDSVKSSERKEDSYTSSKEYLSDCKQNVGINKECKDHSFEISDRKEECAIGPEEKAILVIRHRRTCLNCVHDLVFCGRQNM